VKVLCTIALALIGVAPLAAQSTQELNFLSGLQDGRDLRDMLPSYVKGKADQLLAERRRKIAQFSSMADVTERKRHLRQRMLKALGGFPERTPLNARVVGVLDRGDYTIEKVIFESQPRFYVTANLYLPKKGRPPYPGRRGSKS
jgi:hypothetical protein